VQRHRPNHAPPAQDSPLLVVKGAAKRFGGVVAVADLDLQVERGGMVGVIGPNGAGKSTLLRILAGIQRLDAGEIWLDGQRIDGKPPHRVARAGIGLANQIPRPFRRLTVRQNIEVGAHANRGRAQRAQIDDILDRTGLTALAERPAAGLGLLDLKRLELARALSLDPLLLLLDEVAAGLDGVALEEVVELVREINASGVTVMLVEHIEALVHSLARRVYVLDWGVLVASGTPDEIAADHHVREIYLGGQNAADGPTSAPGRALKLHGGDRMIELEAVSARFGQLRAVDDATVHVERGELVAVLGANGAGKTTLAKLATGAVRPSSGAIRFDGADVTAAPAHGRAALGIAYCPEGRRLFGDMTVADNLHMGAYPKRAHAGIAGRTDRVCDLFPMLRERSKQLAGTLSGGQQQMLAIGRALMADPLLLVLDEVSLGLSPKAADEIYAALAEISRGGVSILLMEQSVYRALRVADRAYVMDRGRIVFAGPAAELRDGDRLPEVYFGATGNAASMTPALGSVRR
jgi:branched-chain amino acid transport system ATP-binding protein